MRAFWAENRLNLKGPTSSIRSGVFLSRRNTSSVGLKKAIGHISSDETVDSDPLDCLIRQVSRVLEVFAQTEPVMKDEGPLRKKTH